MANEFKVKKGLIVDGSNTVLDVQGTQGQLFSVTDSLTGDLFSVSDVSGVPILNVNSSGAITFDGYVPDNNKLKFGDSGDLEIYHDGNHSRIKDAGQGHLTINATDFVVNNSADTKNMIIATDGGSVNLYYNASQKFRTINAGAEVTGHLLPAADSTYNLGADATRWSFGYFDSLSSEGISATNSLTTPTIQLQNDLNILNKAQTSYLTLADRDTGGAEVVYNLGHIGKVSVGGGDTSTAQVALKGQQSLLSFLRGTSGDAQFFMSSDSARLYFSHTDTSSDNFILTLNEDKNVTVAGNLEVTGSEIELGGNWVINGTDGTYFQRIKTIDSSATDAVDTFSFDVKLGSSAAWKSLLVLDQHDAARFSGTISSGKITTTVSSGNNIELRKGDGTGAVGFGGTTHQTGLIEGVDGGGLKLYTAGNDVAWNGAWSLNTTWSGKNMTVAGNITAGSTSLTASNNYVLDVKKAYSSGYGHVAYFGAGSNTAAKTNFDTVVVAQDDVPCLAIIEGNDANTQSSQQALRLAVGDNNAVISTSNTSGGLLFFVNRATDATGFATNSGTKALHLLNNGNAQFAGIVSVPTGKAFRLYNAAGSGWAELTFNETDNKVQFNRGIQPSGNNQTDQTLGTSTKRWSTLYAGAGDFSGNITANRLTTSGVTNNFTTGVSWGTNLQLTNTNDDASPSILTFLKSPASGHTTMADNDYIGFINFRADNSNNDIFSWVELSALAIDVTDGSEDSAFRIGTWGGGTEVANTIMAKSGQVGIGDASPSTISANTYSLSVNSSRSDLTGALISKANGAVKHQQYWDSSGYGFHLSGSSGDFRWTANNENRMVLDKDGGIDLQGTVGQLFSVTNSLTGDLFSVSDISGIPILNVNSNGDVDVDGELNIKNASTRFISLNYENSVNSIISHSGTNYGLETLHIRGDQINFYTDYDSSSPQGNITMGLDANHDVTFANRIIVNGGTSDFGGDVVIQGDATVNRGLYPDTNYGAELGTANLRFSNIRGKYCDLQQSSTSDPALRLTDEGVASYDFIFPDTSTIKLETNTTSTKTFKLLNAGSGDFNFYAEGTITAGDDVIAFSDERLKTNIKTLDGSKVYEMRGVSFTKNNKKGSGVIAQELEKITPELVNNDGEYKAVAYGNITGYLIEAIKDLKAEIEELKKQIK